MPPLKRGEQRISLFADKTGLERRDQLALTDQRHVQKAVPYRNAHAGRGGRIGAAKIGPVLTPDDIMGGLVPAGRILMHDIEGGYMGGLIAEKLRLSGAEVILSTPNLSHSGFLSLTLEQDRVLRRLIALGVTLTASRDLAGFEPGSAHLTSTLGAADLEIPADHLVLVADRVPRDSLARDLMLCPDRVQAAGILSVDRIGDCLAPGLIAHAVYAGHRLARMF